MSAAHTRTATAGTRWHPTSIDALTTAAREVFSVSGMDAPAHEIATKARVASPPSTPFPERPHLVTAVIRHDRRAIRMRARLIAAARLSSSSPRRARCCPVQVSWWRGRPS